MSSQEVRQSPRAEPRFFYGYIVVVAALCIMIAIWGAYYAFGVFFKPMLTEFGWTRAMTSGAFSLSMVLLSADKQSSPRVKKVTGFTGGEEQNNKARSQRAC